MDQPIVVFIVIAVVLLVYFLWGERTSAFFGRKPAPDRKFHRSKLVSVLLNLNDRAVDELLELYKREFGPGPARYARRTYRKWKTGHVQPATQTFQRFLQHLPKVMSYDLKCEVLRLFMEEYAAKDRYELDVYTDDWEEKLTPLVHQIIEKAFTAQLPIEVERKVRWLGEGDMQAAQSILRRSQVEEGNIIVSMLREEFATMEKLLAEEHLEPRVSHTLKFPYGTIDMTIRRR